MIAAGETTTRLRGRQESGSLRDDTLELGFILRKLRKHEGNGAPSPWRTVPNLLAANFRFHLSARLLRRGRPRFDPGFFSYGA
jgi:hypothetical protein